MKIGFIGTGLMGEPMARRLLSAGHKLRVYNRTRAKAEGLGTEGAEIAETPGEVFTFGDATVLMLSDANAIRTVLGCAGEAPELTGRTILQMSTIGADESRAFHCEVERRGGHYLEAPVLGSTPQAEAGELIVMVGGSQELFERWRPLLARFGPEPLLLGPVGRAAATKLALNQLIAALSAAFDFSLGLIREHGVDVDAFMRILRASKLHAPTFDAKLPRLLARDFSDPHFPVKHLLKDMRLAQEAGRARGLETAALDGVLHVIERALVLGLDDQDYSAIYNAVHPA